MSIHYNSIYELLIGNKQGYELLTIKIYTLSVTSFHSKIKTQFT